MSAADIEDAAVALARQGLRVFPIRADRMPACKWSRDATDKPENVQGFWWHADSLIGVVTGTPGGISVLDIDTKDGKRGDRWLAENFDRLPHTRVHVSRSGGYHLLFRHVEGVHNSVGRIAPGVDVRGEGGMVIWWPAAGCEVVEAMPLHKLPPWPPWLMPPQRPPAARPPAQLGRMPAGRQQAYASAALHRAAGRIATEINGRRNAALNSEVFSLTRLVHERALDPQQLADVMFKAAMTAGLEREETINTIRSALRAGGVNG